jgi:hypothetical protein
LTANSPHAKDARAAKGRRLARKTA